MLTPFGNWPNSKREKPKPQNNSASRFLTSLGLRCLKGYPTQSWLYWMNENALRVEMGIPLLFTKNTHIQKSVA